ncbi:alpha/beta fold hydrolase [Cryobacterium sp. PH29-G1]|uniref:alpha/beta fold hydrolase n=1 Tax=Cryobacterium sp. PH29-G1 TaxID=3046211 RepID=UPI0024BB99F2|nr:alpha/beta fold hydrolase [Cryobacterium sp. PH29-G1]MDJ0348028.1 alpha/beta fold hydrolase [Cryobacterium sp. PH29-G1]
MTDFARRLDGVRIAFDAAPGARPVLLVHGFASTAEVTWGGSGWVRALAEAQRGAITPDLRGHGRSDKPHHAADYEPRQLAADLVVVLDTLELERVDVIGYSMGSRVVAALARLVPERVHRLVLGGAGPIELFATWDADAVNRFVAHGDLPADPTIAAVLGPIIASGADLDALVACVQGFAGSTLDVPAGIPQLFVAGGADPITAGIATLAADRGARYLELPGRTHLNALTSREFREAALQFLA